MSKYREAKTVFKDAQLLIEALESIGLPNPQAQSLKGKIEYHTNAQHLIGYGGDTRSETANIIIRRKLTGQASNDVGFNLNPLTQTYDAVISDFDQSCVGLNQKWLTSVSVAYREAFTIRQAAKQGARLIGRTKVNGKVQLQFAMAGR